MKLLRSGKAYERVIVGKLLLEGFDVYLPEVDDQGIDGVIRVIKNGKIDHYDFQCKGSESFSGIRLKLSKVHEKMFCFFYSRKSNEILWLDYKELKENFKETGYEWGDVFFRKHHLEAFKKEGYFELNTLRNRLLG